MTATTKARPPKTMEIERPRLSTIRGLKGVDFDARAFDDDGRGPAFNALTLLKCCAGSAVEFGYATHDQPDSSGWRTLRECDPREIARAVSRVESLSAPWRLPGTGELLDRLDVFFAGLVA